MEGGRAPEHGDCLVVHWNHVETNTFKSTGFVGT